MRSEERLDRIIEKLRKLWKNYPDYRLCQLVYVVAKGTDKMQSDDVFHIGDDDFEASLDSMLKE